MAIIVLKNALTFAATCRKPGCAELRDILSKIRFAGPRPRMEAPTAAEIVAAREAAHQIGHRAAALAYALQFEGAMRQWDVVGKWVPLADKKPSSVIDGTSKWIGPMWSQIDENMILRYSPSKTAFTSGATVMLDLSMMPMVVEELEKVPVEARRGPLIINPRTGLPYRNWYFGEVWRQVRKSPASARRSGIGICGLPVSPKDGRRTHRPTIWRSKPGTPTSAPRRRSMIVTDSKLTGGSPKRGPPIAERRVIGVCRNVSRPKANSML
jgi:hypothetical protein